MDYRRNSLGVSNLIRFFRIPTRVSYSVNLFIFSCSKYMALFSSLINMEIKLSYFNIAFLHSTYILFCLYFVYAFPFSLGIK